MDEKRILNLKESVAEARDKNPFEKLSDIACRVLREAIITCVFAPGEKLIVAQLASELGISRTPVREAIERLCTEGYIQERLENSEYRNFYALDLSEQDARQLYDMRKAIEGAAAYLCAQRSALIDTKHLKALSAAFRSSMLESTSKCSSEEEIYINDWAFHSYIVKNCSNKYLNDMYFSQENLIRHLNCRSQYNFSNYAFVSQYGAEDIIVIASQHAAIAHAIANSMPAVARDLSYDHMEACKNNFLYARGKLDEGRFTTK